MPLRHLLAFAFTGLTMSAQGQDAMPHQPVATAALVQQVCAACHGLDGNSRRAGVPSLAGQVQAYLEGQLHAFAAQGDLRANGVMGAIAVNLNADEMKRVSIHYAHQSLRPTKPVDAPRWIRRAGEKIFYAGLPAKGVASCASCHGTRAQGLPDLFPRLAGQHAAYVAEQLRHFRSGRRTSDPHAMMRNLAARLSDRDIDAVATFVASLR